MGRRAAVAAIAAAALLPLVPATTAHAETPTPPPPLGLRDKPSQQFSQDTDTIIVTFDQNQDDPEQAATDVIENAASQVAGADIVAVTPITDRTVAVILDQSVTPAEAAEIGGQAEDNPGVRAAEPSATLTTGATNDPYYDYLWNLREGSPSRYGVNAEGAWPESAGSGVIVGVIDTGITNHPDLDGRVVDGYDFVSDLTKAGDGDGRDSDPADPGDYCPAREEDSSWHGTHVAGIIAAIRNNRVGAVGVAPGAQVEALRALGRCGGAEADIIAAIRWGAGLSVTGLPANPNPVGVLNLSLGGAGGCSIAMQDAINAAVAKGVAVVVAAGNDNRSLGTTMPANCRNVIRVTASTYEGGRAPYSNYGSSGYPATIAAPGGSGLSTDNPDDWIISTWNNGRTGVGTESYVGMVGTSMAAPHVAAVAALLRAKDPRLTPAQVTAVMVHTATPMPDCDAVVCGAGIVNASALVVNPVTNLATPRITGAAMVGGTLTTAGIVATGAAYTYQWLRDGAEISGAAASTYTLAATDSGTALSVRVTASLLGRTASVTSEQVTVLPNLVTGLEVPVITGTAQVGQKLTTAGAGATGASYTYQWLRNGTPITGATGASRTLTSYDHRAVLSVRVAASYLGQSASQTSAGTAPVAAGAFSNRVRPYTSGTYRKGYTLKANPGTWSPTASTVKYRWLRNGAPIWGAISSRYKLTSADRGRYISVRVTVSRSGYTTRSTDSARHRIR